MNLKGISKYIVFGALFSIWIVSLIVIYLPISGWGTPTFPLSIDNNMMTIFLVSGGLSSFTSLYIGFNILGINSKIKTKIQGIKQTHWFKNLRNISVRRSDNKLGVTEPKEKAKDVP